MLKQLAILSWNLKFAGAFLMMEKCFCFLRRVRRRIRIFEDVGLGSRLSRGPTPTKLPQPGADAGLRRWNSKIPQLRTRFAKLHNFKSICQNKRLFIHHLIHPHLNALKIILILRCLATLAFKVRSFEEGEIRSPFSLAELR